MIALLVLLAWLVGGPAAAAAPAPAPGSCAYALETVKLANAELKRLEGLLKETPDGPSPRAEILVGEAFGVMSVRDAAQKEANLKACEA